MECMMYLILTIMPRCVLSGRNRFKSVSYTHLDVYKRQTIYINIHVFTGSQQFAFPFCTFQCESQSLRDSVARNVADGAPDLDAVHVPFAHGPLAEITDGIRDDPFSPVGGKQPVAYFRSPVRGIGEVEPDVYKRQVYLSP